MGMFAPLAWVLASPMTLALYSLPVRYARWSSNLLHHSFFFYLTHPITATLLNIGGMYLLYATPLYQASLNNLALHLMIHVHFIFAGYLYCWSIAGCEPSFHPFSFKMRLTVLLLGIAAHSYLAKLMYINLWPSLPFYSSDSADNIQTAAKIMYYGGDLAEGLLAMALFNVWLNHRKRLVKCSKSNILSSA
ncbi:cytochrome c oxidase assembly protein [Cellvibrio sp. ARAG 10.3]|uniref:cytochrome c oxidase assembly protein n=1 Tax=Cellvibrio sp. ARAG 10.3 TaxID=3451358 RepID=UPI003F46F83D